MVAVQSFQVFINCENVLSSKCIKGLVAHCFSRVLVVNSRIADQDFQSLMNWDVDIDFVCFGRAMKILKIMSKLPYCQAPRSSSSSSNSNN